MRTRSPDQPSRSSQKLFSKHGTNPYRSQDNMEGTAPSVACPKAALLQLLLLLIERTFQEHAQLQA
jgi:hypothetical protein